MIILMKSTHQTGWNLCMCNVSFYFQKAKKQIYTYPQCHLSWRENQALRWSESPALLMYPEYIWDVCAVTYSYILPVIIMVHSLVNVMISICNNNIKMMFHSPHIYTCIHSVTFFPPQHPIGMQHNISH